MFEINDVFKLKYPCFLFFNLNLLSKIFGKIVGFISGSVIYSDKLSFCTVPWLSYWEQTLYMNHRNNIMWISFENDEKIIFQWTKPEIWNQLFSILVIFNVWVKISNN